MDGHAFDELTRLVFSDSTRRTAIKRLAAGSLGVAFTRLGFDQAAAACIEVGRRCSRRRGPRCCKGAACRDDRCQCKGRYTECEKECVNLKTDEENCGECGRACGPDEHCRRSACIGQGCLSYKLDGDATPVDSGVQLRSVGLNVAGALIFTVGSNVNFEDITRLQTEYAVAPGDECVGGAPRFSILFEEGNVFAYIATSPGLNTCPDGPIGNSGNLIGNNDPNLWDTGQIAGGNVLSTYDQALDLLHGKRVTDIFLVVDAGWAQVDDEQVVIVKPCVKVR